MEEGEAECKHRKGCVCAAGVVGCGVCAHFLLVEFGVWDGMGLREVGVGNEVSSRDIYYI